MSEANLYERDRRALADVQKLRFFPLEAATGDGCHLVEPGGRRLLDLSATWAVNGLGHGHPALVEAVTVAVRSAPGAGAISAAGPDAVALAEELLAAVPGSGDRRVHLGHAGSDANDVALRACRHATGRTRIAAFEHSYHGGIGLAQSVSGVQIDAGAAASPDLVLLPYPDPFRPHRGTIEDSTAHALARTEEELARGDVAALIVEPILSDGGVVVPPDGFLAGLHAICRRHGVPLICDEVKVGLARTGLLHGFQHEGLVPDLVTFGKSLGGGLPISAVVGPAGFLDQPGGSALLTTTGNPVCAAAARAVLRTIEAEGLAAAAAVTGERIVDGLRTAFAASSTDVRDRVGEVRGRGLSVGVDLVTDPATRKPDGELARKVVYRGWQLGAVFYYVGGNVLEITPPLVLTEPDADRAVAFIVQAVTDAVGGVVSDEAVAPYAGW